MAAEIERTAQDERDQVRQRWAHAWQQRLSDLVEEHPDVGGALAEWAERVRAEPATPDGRHGAVFVARGQAQQYNAPGGSITVTHHHGGSPTS